MGNLEALVQVKFFEKWVKRALINCFGEDMVCDLDTTNLFFLHMPADGVPEEMGNLGLVLEFTFDFLKVTTDLFNMRSRRLGYLYTDFLNNHVIPDIPSCYQYGTHFGSAYRVSMQGIYSLKELYFHALGQVDKEESTDIEECLEKDLAGCSQGYGKTEKKYGKLSRNMPSFHGICLEY